MLHLSVHNLSYCLKKWTEYTNYTDIAFSIIKPFLLPYIYFIFLIKYYSLHI